MAVDDQGRVACLPGKRPGSRPQPLKGPVLRRVPDTRYEDALRHLWMIVVRGCAAMRIDQREILFTDRVRTRLQQPGTVCVVAASSGSGVAVSTNARQKATAGVPAAACRMHGRPELTTSKTCLRDTAVDRYLNRFASLCGYR